MFICERCKKATEPREPQTSIVVETRKRVYNDGTEDDPRLSYGTETVKEIKVCVKCSVEGVVNDEGSIIPIDEVA